MPAAELSARAQALALEHRLSVSDTANLAMAQRSGAALITAEDQLESSAQRCGCITF